MNSLRRTCDRRVEKAIVPCRSLAPFYLTVLDIGETHMGMPKKRVHDHPTRFSSSYRVTLAFKQPFI
jgi:hypothetical protein